uniref:Uncharacterized protein n=1 Tax=Arundo donax TaxID=35708 RepID=A0A0A9AS36_ARUDO
MPHQLETESYLLSQPILEVSVYFAQKPNLETQELACFISFC